MNDTTTGLTKDAGWQLGIRRTVPHARDRVWAYLLGDGRAGWLGVGDALPTEKGADYTTGDGIHGSVRSYEEGRLVRVSWRDGSILQLRLADAATGTTIGIHQEKLPDADSRRTGLDHWSTVLDRITAELAAASTT